MKTCADCGMPILGARLEGGVGGSRTTHISKDDCFISLKAYYAIQQEKVRNQSNES